MRRRARAGVLALLLAGCGAEVECPPGVACREDVPAACEASEGCRSDGLTAECGDDPEAAPFWACGGYYGVGATQCVRFYGGACAEQFVPVRCPDDDLCCFEGSWPYPASGWPGIDGPLEDYEHQDLRTRDAVSRMQTYVDATVQVDAAVTIPDPGAGECSFPTLAVCRGAVTPFVGARPEGLSVLFVPADDGSVSGPLEAPIVSITRRVGALAAAVALQLGYESGRFPRCQTLGDRRIDSATVTLATEELTGDAHGRLDLVLIGGQRVALGF